MAKRGEQVFIVGAGVAGLCIATELVSRGIYPTVYEPQREPGPQSCSWWAGGMLAPYCESESAEQSVVTYGKTAADWWQKHTGLVEQQGTLVVATGRDRNELKRFAKLTERHKTLDGSEIASLEPDLEDRFHHGLFFESEAHLAPRDAIRALKASLIKNGVTFKYKYADPKALALEGRVIDTRGIKAREDIAALRGVKGEMLVLKCPEVTLKRPVRLLHPRIPLYIVPRGNGIFMLGATMIESSAKANATVRSVMELLNAAYTINPAFGEAEILEIGVDSRPAFVDNLPKITVNGNLVSANGLYRHGFLLSPTLANMVSDYIELGVSPPWLATQKEHQ